MSATALYQAGKLDDAIAAQIQDVKAAPADRGKRLFLFELLAFSGDLARARKQLDVIQYDDPDLQRATESYRRLLDAEEARRKVFREGGEPKFLLDPPTHVKHRLEAVTRLREGKPVEAADLLDKAAAETPDVPGSLNEKAVGTVRDGDDLFGTVLEVLAHGEYFWVPLEQVETLTMNAPKFPRDLIWMPARLEVEGSAGEVFLSALYPGSHESADVPLRLGRATDWAPVAAEDGPARGVGTHLFLVDGDPVALPDWRQFARA